MGFRFCPIGLKLIFIFLENNFDKNQKSGPGFINTFSTGELTLVAAPLNSDLVFDYPNVGSLMSKAF